MSGKKRGESKACARRLEVKRRAVSAIRAALVPIAEQIGGAYTEADYVDDALDVIEEFASGLEMRKEELEAEGEEGGA